MKELLKYAEEQAKKWDNIEILYDSVKKYKEKSDDIQYIALCNLIMAIVDQMRPMKDASKKANELASEIQNMLGFLKVKK